MRQKTQHFLLWVLILIMGIVLVTSIKLDVLAKEPVPEYRPYYKSVLLKEGDNLWSLAKEYSTGGPYTLDEYISELKSINGLREDTIHTGCYLTVVYFEPVLHEEPTV